MSSLEISFDNQGSRSWVLTSQNPTNKWHQTLRIVHRYYDMPELSDINTSPTYQGSGNEVASVFLSTTVIAQLSPIIKVTGGSWTMCLTTLRPLAALDVE